MYTEYSAFVLKTRMTTYISSEALKIRRNVYGKVEKKLQKKIKNHKTFQQL